MDRQNSIGLQIKTFSNLIKRCLDEVGNSELGQEITGMQGWIIGYLYDHQYKQDIFQRDIEKVLNIRRSTATGIVQLMEKNGYIIRESVEHDARLKKLILTPKAIEVHCMVMKKVNEIERRLRQGLSEEEIQYFFQIIEKMKHNIE